MDTSKVNSQQNKIEQEVVEVIKRLRKIRREKEISQEHLANLAGLHRNYIGMIERLEYTPTLGVVCKMAKSLNIKLEDLFKGL
jgi:DNA-binding XRE family transcriptional regulator